MARVFAVFLILSLFACGKNDGAAPYGYANGYSPYNGGPVAPPPPGGFYSGPTPGGFGYPSQGGYGYPNQSGYGYPNQGGYGYPGAGSPYAGSPSGGFNPQIPPGYPSSYYPFLPINGYFQQNPGMQNYWNNFFGGWQQYAANQGYDPYNFTPFWTEYAANQWGNGSPYSGLYNSFNNNVYYWVTPQTQFPSYANPATFWAPYAGMSYSTFNQDCGCGF